MLQHLNLDDIIPTEDQPRKTFYQETLEELAQSIRERGVLEPIVVRPLPDGKYKIIMGERRYRASRLAGLTEIPAIIREVSEEDAKVDALLENFQREDLNPVERARAIEGLLEVHSLEQVAKMLGKAEATIKRHLEILDLPQAVLDEMVDRPGDNPFGEGHALVLKALSEDPVSQVRLARKIKEERLSIEETQRFVHGIINFPDKKEALLRVPLRVAEEIIRSTARERGTQKKRPFKPKTAQSQAAAVGRAMDTLNDQMDPRMVDFLSREECSTLLASATALSDTLKTFISKLRSLLSESSEFHEIYINCALCGRIELVDTPRCSVCWSVMKRCDDCGHYDRQYQMCSIDETHIPIPEAEVPSETSRSYKCQYYSPKFEARRAA